MKFYFRKHKSEAEGKLEVSLRPLDEGDEKGIIVHVDNLAFLLDRVEAEAFAAAVRETSRRGE